MSHQRAFVFVSSVPNITRVTPPICEMADLYRFFLLRLHALYERIVVVADFDGVGVRIFV